MSENIEICKACGVSIDVEQDIVHFSCGKPGTRERLLVRVCQYAKDYKNCLNQDLTKIKTPKDSDYWDEAKP